MPSDKKPIFTCPKCGNIERFYEEGLARIKNEIRFEYRKGSTPLAVEGELQKVGDIISPDITCAKCGAKI